MKSLHLFIIFVVTNIQIYSQLDSVKVSWPFPPFNQQHKISATFAEFRDTETSDHFHNAVDIPEPDGNPCYPVLDGIVDYKYTTGTNAYIRVVTEVGGGWKHMTYLHVFPNPALTIGDSVKQGITILGNVISGMGHCHLIERDFVSSISSIGVEINNLRKNGGLTPYNDSWAPIIHEGTLKFFTNASTEIQQSTALYGKVDIQIKIEEINGSTAIERNNGTYLAGYRVWNDSKTQIIYEPDDGGVKYRFDRLPSNSYVHNAFVKNVATYTNPVYWITNGDGADYINDTRVVGDNFFDASLLPSGNYQLEIFTEDTRDNKSNKFFPITVVDPKLTIPQIYSLLNTTENNGLVIQWKKNSESDVVGYRLYYSSNTELTDWQLAADESLLTNEINEYTILASSDFVVPPSAPAHYFALTAIDQIGQESDKSDVFVRSDLIVESYPVLSALIVNAFPRVSGLGGKESHKYTATYFNALSAIDSIIISSVSNNAFLDNIIKEITFLQNYDLVIWYTGDNTNHVTTIQPKEMYHMAQYLENGGNLYMSGSKIGYDLDELRSNLPADTLFYHHYLKSKFIYVGNDLMKPVSGLNNTPFANVILNYGQAAEEKYPDDIDPIYGGEVLLNFNQFRQDSLTYRHAGVGYKGKFGSSNIDGAMVYTSFPLETVGLLTEQQEFFKSLLKYFNIITHIDNETQNVPTAFSLSPNYPNPFNPSTNIEYTVPSDHKSLIVRLAVYDILGREVKILVNKKQKPGSYQVVFNAQNLASGIYFARLSVGDSKKSMGKIFNKTISMVLLK